MARTNDDEPGRPAASAPPAAPSPIVQELVARCIERWETKGEGALDEIGREHPEHVEAVRRHLDVLLGMGLLLKNGEVARAFPERLGEFRLVKCLGGGGMGVVYLAIQESLGREVALKLVRPEHLYFPTARARFQREAQAIARLQHPAIVPIYAFGEENGVPYFAMEHVDGLGLDQVIERLAGRPPATLDGAALGALFGLDAETSRRAFGGSWVETCFRIEKQVAEAIDHAHERGVIHRDVKPSNVMLTRDGRARLFDFGLSSSAQDSRMTRSGSLLGSLPYLPPERLRGAATEADRTADVYGLGVTLYELLTLELPYQGGDAEATRAAILHGAPPPMTAKNPSVPWDAETVCLTAFEREPARRYPTAAAFARDLGHVLSLQPIEAKRAGVDLRLKRWVQRHPTRSVAALLAAFVVVVLPTLLLLQAKSANKRINASLGAETKAKQAALDEKKIADQQTLEAMRQRDATRASYVRTINAIDVFLVKFGERLASVPKTEALRKEMIEKALRFYLGLHEDSKDEVSLRRERAFIRTKLVALQMVLGRSEQAQSELTTRMSEVEEKLVRAPDDLDLVYELGLLWSDLALVKCTRQAEREAEDAFRKSIQLLGRVLAGPTPDDSAARLVAHNWANLAIFATFSGRTGEAIEAARAAVDALEPLVARAPDLPENQLELGRSLATLADALEFENRDDQAAQVAERAEQLLAAAARAAPNEHDYRYAYATILTIVGGQLTNRRDFAAAEAKLRKAVEMRRRIATAAPTVHAYQWDLGECLDALAEVLAAAQRGSDARAVFEEARAIQQALVDAEPDDPGFRSELAATLGGLAELARQAGDLDGAHAQVTSAIEHQARSLAAKPEDPDISRRMLQHQIVLGNVLGEMKRHGEAVKAFQDGFAAGKRQRRNLRDLAVACAQALERMARDADLDEAELEARSHELAELALHVFDLQIERGEAKKDALLEAAEFAPLLEREEVVEWAKRS